MQDTQTRQITTQERRQAMAAAIGSVRAEDLQPSAATRLRLTQYAEGKITLQQLQEGTRSEFKASPLVLVH